MPDRRYRVLMVASHPVQYMSPIFREMARHPRLDTQVAYCSLHGATPAKDPGFGIEVQWDVPLLDGYRWSLIPNRWFEPRIERFWGLLNTRLWRLPRKEDFDVVVAFTGYAYASFWIFLAASKLRGVPIIFGTDATSIQPRSGESWRVLVKKILLPRVFRLADTVIVPSSAGVEFIRSLGIPADRIVMTPFVVDNEWWLRESAKIDRQAVRKGWKIPIDASVALFCAKLQPWKRPQDALRAFIRANVANSHLVFAGDGPLREELEREAHFAGFSERVHFLGFVNQSGLPAVYCASDLLVLPSEYDPCPVVVAEAMLCGCPAAISDQIRGRFDIVRHNHTGFIFPCADVNSLASIVHDAFSNPEKLAMMKAAATERMETWTIRENVEAMVQAFDKACQHEREDLPLTCADKAVP